MFQTTAVDFSGSSEKRGMGSGRHNKYFLLLQKHKTRVRVWLRVERVFSRCEALHWIPTPHTHACAHTQSKHMEEKTPLVKSQTNAMGRFCPGPTSAIAAYLLLNPTLSLPQPKPLLLQLPPQNPPWLPTGPSSTLPQALAFPPASHQPLCLVRRVAGCSDPVVHPFRKKLSTVKCKYILDDEAAKTDRQTGRLAR